MDKVENPLNPLPNIASYSNEEIETSAIHSFMADLKERLSSPFFSSFIVAWLVANWQIVLATFTYDRQDFLQEDIPSNTLNEYIWLHSDWIHHVLLPLIAALIYCFGYPFLKNKIVRFQLSQKFKSSDGLLKASRTATFTIEQMMTIYKRYAKLLSEASEFYKEQPTLSKELTLANQRNDDLKIQLGNFSDRLKMYDQWSNSQVIAGNWHILNDRDEDQNVDIRSMEIIDWKVMVTFETGNRETFTIIHFIGNPDTKLVSFDLKGTDIKGTIRHVQMVVNPGFTEMKGNIDTKEYFFVNHSRQT